MAIERKSIVDQIEFPRAGGVQVRMALLVVDGDLEISKKWHRTFISDGLSPQLQMEEVNRHLVEMGEAEVSAVDIQRVVDFCEFGAAKPSAAKAISPARELVMPLTKGK